MSSDPMTAAAHERVARQLDAAVAELEAAVSAMRWTADLRVWCGPAADRFAAELRDWRLLVDRASAATRSASASHRAAAGGG